MRNMLARAMRAALLNRGIFRAVGEDPTAILHSFGTVILVGIAMGLGLMEALVDLDKPAVELGSIGDRLLGMWMSIMTVLLGWILWTALIYFTGTRILGGEGSFRQVLRALGIGYGPGVLLALSSVPVYGGVVSFMGLAWVLVTGVVAAHETQKVDWLGAFLSTVLGWFLSFLVLPPFLLAPLLAGP